MSLIQNYGPSESQIPTVSHHGEIPSGQPVCQITIDGQDVTAVVGESILRAAQRAGFNQINNLALPGRTQNSRYSLNVTVLLRPNGRTAP